MNTQRLPGLDAGIKPALAFWRKLDTDMCRNAAASSRLHVSIIHSRLSDCPLSFFSGRVFGSTSRNNLAYFFVMWL